MVIILVTSFVTMIFALVVFRALLTMRTEAMKVMKVTEDMKITIFTESKRQSFSLKPC